jgi:hypothetical protein
MRQGVTGFFLIRFPQDDPSEYNVITAWRNNLNIGDSSMFLSRGLTLDGMAFKELIVGYKTISINTYNTVVLDLSEGNGGR